jgi:hypothetical protein
VRHSDKAPRERHSALHDISVRTRPEFAQKAAVQLKATQACRRTQSRERERCGQIVVDDLPGFVQPGNRASGMGAAVPESLSQARQEIEGRTLERGGLIAADRGGRFHKGSGEQAQLSAVSK